MTFNNPSLISITDLVCNHADAEQSNMYHRFCPRWSDEGRKLDRRKCTPGEKVNTCVDHQPGSEWYYEPPRTELQIDSSCDTQGH